MKKYILFMLSLGIGLATNGQTLLGTNSVDSVLMKSSGSDRIKIRPTGAVHIHNDYYDFNKSGGRGHASVYITPRNFDSPGVLGTADDITLLISDNHNAWGYPAQAWIINYNKSIGFGVSSVRTSTDINSELNKGIVSMGGNAGFWRTNIATNGEQTQPHVGYHCYNRVQNLATGVNLISYSSSGTWEHAGSSVVSMKDYSASNWIQLPSADGGTRYGVFLDYARQKFATAWGVYQSQTDVKNHFNGASLFGTTTDNTLDKVQVIGGTLTDGLAAGSRTETGSYAAVNTDYTIRVNNTVTTTITLPVTNIATGKIFVIKKVSNDPDDVEVVGASSATIDQYPDGSGNYKLSAQYASVTVQFNGTNYDIIAEVIRP